MRDETNIQDIGALVIPIDCEDPLGFADIKTIERGHEFLLFGLFPAMKNQGQDEEIYGKPKRDPPSPKRPTIEKHGWNEEAERHQKQKGQNELGNEGEHGVVFLSSGFKLFDVEIFAWPRMAHTSTSGAVLALIARYAKTIPSRGIRAFAAFARSNILANFFTPLAS